MAATHTQLQMALERERNKLRRQLDAVNQTEAMIATLESLLKASK